MKRIIEGFYVDVKKLSGKHFKAVLLTAALLMVCLTACGGKEKDVPAKDSGAEIVAPSKEEAQAGGEESKEVNDNASMSETGSTGSADGKEAPVAEAGESKVLVAYFSATGTTKKLAEYAADVMGADLYEIVPAEPYTDADLNYNDRNSRTSIEMNDKSIHPAITGSVADMGQYDIVFIGYPIWWGEAPHIMDSFMESYDFSGKTIVPFCTSGSSGIGLSAKNLHAYTDDSVTWLDGARLKSNLSKEDMADWIKGLSLGIGVK